MFTIPSFQRRIQLSKKKYFSLQNKEEKLKVVLIERARHLKQKMMSDSNNHDLNIHKLMNKTLRQMQRHKINFNSDDQFNKNSPQKKTLQQILKDQLLKNIQDCTNKFTQSFGRIKQQRQRIHTQNNQSSDNRKSVQQMLITAKDRFKTQHLDKKKMISQPKGINFLKNIKKQHEKGFLQRSHYSQQKISLSLNNTNSLKTNKFSNKHTFVSLKQVIQPRQAIHLLQADSFKNLSKKSQDEADSFNHISMSEDKVQNESKTLRQINNRSSAALKLINKRFRNRNYPNAFCKNRKQMQVLNHTAQDVCSDRSVFVPIGPTQSISQQVKAQQTKKASTKDIQNDSVYIKFQHQITGFPNIEPHQLKGKISVHKISQNVEIILNDSAVQNSYKKSLDLTSLTQEQLQNLQKCNDTFVDRENFIQLGDRTKVRIKTESQPKKNNCQIKISLYDRGLVQKSTEQQLKKSKCKPQTIPSSHMSLKQGRNLKKILQSQRSNRQIRNDSTISKLIEIISANKKQLVRKDN